MGLHVLDAIIRDWLEAPPLPLRAPANKKQTAKQIEVKLRWGWWVGR